MAKSERFLVYPLLAVALLRAFVSAPVLMAQGTVQERIVCRELAVANQDGVEVVRVRATDDGHGVVLVYDKEGDPVNRYMVFQQEPVRLAYASSHAWSRHLSGMPR